MLPKQFAAFSTIRFSGQGKLVVHRMRDHVSLMLDYGLWQACYSVQIGDKKAFIYHGQLLLPQTNLIWAMPKAKPWIETLMSLINPLWKEK